MTDKSSLIGRMELFVYQLFLWRNHRALLNKIRIILNTSIVKTYLLLIVILFVQSLFMWVFYNNILKQHTKAVNDVLIKNSVDKVESELLGLEKIAVILNFSQRINNFFSFDSHLSNSQVLETVEISRELKSYKNSNKMIKEIFIVSANDIIISDNGVYNMDSLIEFIPQFTGITNIFNEYHYRSFYSTSINKQEPSMLYLQSIPLGSKNTIKSTVMIEIDTEYLSKILDSYKITENTKTILTFPDNETVSDNYVSSDYITKKEVGVISKDCVITKIDFKILNMRLMVLIPISEFNMHMISLKGIIFYVIFVAIFLGVLLALYMVYNDYKDILGIYRKFTDNIDNRPINMIKYISNSVSSITKENCILKENVKKNTGLIKEYALEKILSGDAEKNIYKVLKENDMELRSNEYSVFLINADKRPTDCIAKLKQVLTNNFSEFTDILYSLNNSMIIIVLGLDNIKISINDIGNIFLEVFKKEFSSDISVGISSKKRDIKYIYNAYQEALEANKYGILYEIKCVFYNKVSKNNREQKLYYYPLAIEQKLMSSIKAGNVDNIRSILAKVINENFSKTVLSYNDVKLLIIEITNTIIKVCKEIDVPVNSDIYKIPIDTISINTIFEKLKHHCEDLCENVIDKKKSNNIHKYQSIIEYIENNYNEKGLCLDMIADEYKMSSCYLSQFFKEQSGVYFKDYINMLRVNKAREIIESSETVKIYEVAEKVGYSSSAALIRVFKRYLGVTPGELK